MTNSKETHLQQISLLSDNIEYTKDPRPPISITWNPWHGCTRVSSGCANCYMMTRDRSYGKDPTIVTRTMNFNLPVRKLRNGPYKGLYKIPSGSVIHTCFTSDFFHPAADTWREEAWEAMRIRSDCTFFMITKRPERIASCLPLSFFSTSSTFSSNGRSQSDEWSHISIAVTGEDQRQINRRLPVYLELPLQEHIVVIEPMLGAINLKPFFIRSI